MANRFNPDNRFVGSDYTSTMLNARNQHGDEPPEVHGGLNGGIVGLDLITETGAPLGRADRANPTGRQKS